jgi:exopolysaccharide biosynthesis protein
MVSSLTGKRTTAYELCSIFRALNASGGAIRLDGGPSTSIYYRGSILNPLARPTSILYGSQRQILNAIAIIP